MKRPTTAAQEKADCMLAEIRELARRIRYYSEDKQLYDSVDLAGLILGLDEWILAGNPPPRDWRWR